MPVLVEMEGGGGVDKCKWCVDLSGNSDKDTVVLDENTSDLW